MLIPRRLIQIGRNKTNNQTLTSRKSWHHHHPNFTHLFLLDDDCRRLVGRHGRRAMMAYRSIVQGAQRADICRLAAIFEYGGFYADTDTFAYASLEQVVPRDATMVITQYAAFELFGATRRHPLIRAVLNASIHNINTEVKQCREASTCCKNAHQCIIKLTGPVAFFSALVEHTRRANCTNVNWVPSREQCRLSQDSRVSGLFKCRDTGRNRSKTKSTLCGVARHFDCRNSGMAKSRCNRHHYSRARRFFNYTVR